MDIYAIISLVIAVIGGVVSVFNLWDRFKPAVRRIITHNIPFLNRSIPKQTVCIVPQGIYNKWSAVTSAERAGVFLVSRFFVTNISTTEAQITNVHIKKPYTPGFYMLRHPEQTVWGVYSSIPTNETWEFMIYFKVHNYKVKPSERIKFNVIFYDKFANKTTIMGVEFSHDQYRTNPTTTATHKTVASE